MRVENRTHWQTRDLKAIMTRVAAEELNDNDRQRWQRKHLRVHVVYSRGAHSGCAYLKSTWAKVRIPKSGVDPVEFAWLCAHEFAHVRGQEHRNMSRHVMYFTPEAKAAYAWAAAMPIRQNAPAPIAQPTDEGKYQHVVKMLTLAQTRRKRAVTIERKWQQKARYYEKKMAAGRSGEPK